MTEEIASTPGWVDSRLDEVFAPLPSNEKVTAARSAYSACLAARKAPAAPSDTLGTEFAACAPALRHALTEAGCAPAIWATLAPQLEALEAEVAADS